MAKPRHQQRMKRIKKKKATPEDLNGNSIRKFLRTNAIALISIVATVLTGFVVYYLSYAVPDIRVVKSGGVVVLDQKVDEENNIAMLIRSTDTYKNLSIRSGYIDKVEYIPTTLDKIPIIKVLSVNKAAIAWREEKDVEITATITVPMEAFNKAVKTGNTKIMLDQKVYDNTGKLIDTTVRGGDAWMKIGVEMKY